MEWNQFCIALIIQDILHNVQYSDDIYLHSHAALGLPLLGTKE